MIINERIRKLYSETQITLVNLGFEPDKLSGGPKQTWWQESDNTKAIDDKGIVWINSKKVDMPDKEFVQLTTTETLC